MRKALEREVRRRAHDRCEYCLLPQYASPLTFNIDHVIARQHRGRTVFQNLALSCGRCNLSKGPNIAGVDPQTGNITRLFNPRIDEWSDHFRYDRAVLTGLTDIGRCTIAVLSINQRSRITVRLTLIDEGVFPPQ
jgi:5-methylcytosine-specific restriction endonuclease McrA